MNPLIKFDAKLPATLDNECARALERELDTWLRNFVSKRTRETYQNAVREFVGFSQANEPMPPLYEADDFCHIERRHIIYYRDALLSAGASERSVHNRLSALSSLFKHLCETHNIAQNPVDGVKRPKVDQSSVSTQVITVEQVKALLDAPEPDTLKGLRDRAVLHLLCYSGCRISEVCSLQIKDFFEDDGYPVLDFTVKGGKKNRLAIHQVLQTTLNDYLRVAPHGENREAPLICGWKKDHRERGLTRRQIDRIFQRYALQAGLPLGVTPHSARATFITVALENNCPIEAVQRSVGHSKVSTTQMYDKRHRHHRDSASFVVKY